jgi:hypothetical protein
MKNQKNIDPNPGDLVRLKLLPPGLLNDLPLEDRKAIVKASSSPMRLVEYMTKWEEPGCSSRTTKE